MTENTIDLASIPLNSSSSSDTAGPGAIGVCRQDSSFKKSLNDAMQIPNTPGDVVRDDAGHGLPLVRQELPGDGTFDGNIDSLQELRALADAITGATVSVTEKNSELLTSGSAFFGAPASVNGTFASIAEGAEYFNGDPKLQIKSFRDSVAFTTQETKIVTTDTFLAAENLGGRDNRQSSIENQNGISLAPQQKIQSVLLNKEVQSPQTQAASKSPDVVSTTELATHLRVLKSSGGGEARLQLHPAELGRMTVSLTTEGSEARVAFVVDNIQARQAVEASLPRLRDLMDGAGLDLTDADVSERDSENSKSRSDHQTSDDSGTSSSEGGNIFDESSLANGTHLIDAFA